MPMNATPIRRIWEMPNHQHYGPVRRAWIMLEQLFADIGGVAALEMRINAFRDQAGMSILRWDEHLADLIAHGLREPDAQRTVIQQMITAYQFTA